MRFHWYFPTKPERNEPVLSDKPLKKQTFLGGAAVLALSTAIVKIIGACYKIPLGNLIGDAGFGYFTTAYDIYSVLLMVATTVQALKKV